ncbi:MAG: ABC transporter permease [Thermoprotei archaeon]|nr:ABC transporter permease [Thermoprotei archaeon]
MYRKLFYLILTFLLIFSSLSLIILPARSSMSITHDVAQSSVDFKSIINEINMTNVRRHVYVLSSFGSRMSGYPGSFKAAEYIYNKFKEYGLQDVHYEYFNVTIPVDYGANITILGPERKVIKAYPLLPNHVNTCPTPPGGLTGKLIWGDYGRLEDFDGKDVEGSIVLMHFNCRWYWRNAINLGAKAVIFIEPKDPSLRMDAMMKVLYIPVNIPRLWVSYEDGLYLMRLAKRGDVLVRIRSFMKWETRLVPNVIGLVNGTDPDLDEDRMIISAYYDSYSVVPSLAPGATEALGVAALLEIARYFASHPSRRPVLFVAFSGHSQALAGGREFTWQHFNEVGVKYKIMFQIFLSSESDNLAVSTWGSFYRLNLAVPGFEERFKWISSTIFSRYVSFYDPSRGKARLPGIDKEYTVFDSYYVSTLFYSPEQGYSPVPPGIMEPPDYPLSYEFEAFELAGGLGVIFRTTNVVLRYVYTPFDTPDRVNFENVLPQLEFILCVLYGFSQEDYLAPGITLYPSKYESGWGFTSVRGQVLIYNLTKGWYEPVPYALVYVSTIHTAYVQSPNVVIQADANGTFVFHGIRPSGALTIMQTPVQLTYQFDGYVMNYTSGNVEYANEYGGYGPPRPYLFGVTVYRPDMFVWVRVFKCSSIVLLGTISPRSLEPLQVYWAGQALGAAPRPTATPGTGPVFWIFDFRTHTPLLAPLSVGPVLVDRQDTIFFVPSNVPVEILIRLKGMTIGVLNNATSQYPEGRGYLLKKGAVLRITNGPFKVFSEFLCLISSRLERLHRYHAYSPKADLFFEMAKERYAKAVKYLKEKKYSLAYNEIYAGLSYLVIAYDGTMEFYRDVMNTAVFFFLLIIPFCLLFERLTVTLEGPRRLMALIAIFSICAFIFSLLHPGTQLATNFFIVLIAFTIVGALSLPACFLVFGEFASFLSEVKKRILGLHFAEIGRLGATVMAFITGIENMKRRKLRTILTLMSLIVLVFAMVTFTSAAFINWVVEQKLPTKPSYEGILIRLPELGYTTRQMLPEPALTYVFSHYKEMGWLVAPRAWLYAPNQELWISPHVVVQALLGLSPDEYKVFNLKDVLVSGRWFDENDYKVCIISSDVAKRLNASIGSTINIWGVEVKIIGIFNGLLMNDKLDLDNSPLTPIDQIESSTSQRTIYMDSSQVIILPFNLVMDLGGSIASIAIMPKNVSDACPSCVIEREASVLALRLNALVYAGVKDYVKMYSMVMGYELVGFENMVIPILVLALNIFVTMLGNIQERTREIGVLSAVGLAPTHVAGMFLAESILYAIFSSVLGYLLGIAGVRIIDILGLRPKGFYPSYVSFYVLLSIGVSCFSVIVSTLYPAYKASRVVTPSVERSWKPPTKPKGDEWEVPLPFISVSIEEAIGVMEFMREYFMLHSTERAGLFLAREVHLNAYPSKNIIILEMKANMAPWDAGIVQLTRLVARRSEAAGKRWTYSVYIRRLEGYRYVWESTNYAFVDRIRQQLLLWRGLSPEQRSEYVRRGLSLVQKSYSQRKNAS